MRSVKNYVILTGLSEQPDLRKGILKYGLKKNTGWIFIIIGWMCAHTSNTHPTWKVNFASDYPFKVTGPYFTDLCAWSKEHGAAALRACPNPLLLE